MSEKNFQKLLGTVLLNPFILKNLEDYIKNNNVSASDLNRLREILNNQNNFERYTVFLKKKKLGEFDVVFSNFKRIFPEIYDEICERFFSSEYIFFRLGSKEINDFYLFALSTLNTTDLNEAILIKNVLKYEKDKFNLSIGVQFRGKDIYNLSEFCLLAQYECDLELLLNKRLETLNLQNMLQKYSALVIKRGKNNFDTYKISNEQYETLQKAINAVSMEELQDIIISAHNLTSTIQKFVELNLIYKVNGEI